jgi:hypothetical protein
MASGVVAILDRDEWGANTDIIVVADDRRRCLTWVPRDLWSVRLGDRINAAFRRGGCTELMQTLGEFGLYCSAALVLRRSAVEAALAPVTVTVPVVRHLDFWYPLAPNLPIEEGRKQISFSPPSETLSGERIHQWIGARKMIKGEGSDILRLRRQQVLLKHLLAQDFDFQSATSRVDLVRSAGEPLAVLRQVAGNWHMTIFGPTIPAMIGDRAVLTHTSRVRWLVHEARAAWWRLRRVRT